MCKRKALSSSGIGGFFYFKLYWDNEISVFSEISQQLTAAAAIDFGFGILKHGGDALFVALPTLLIDLW